jgi:hypothetical protein
MPNCTEEFSSERLEFGHLGRRAIEARFDGGSMNDDGGVMLLAALDQRLGLTAAAARAIIDPREPTAITHSIRDMFRQRVYGLVQGWEDLNNHTQLRRDSGVCNAKRPTCSPEGAKRIPDFVCATNNAQNTLRSFRDYVHHAPLCVEHP